MEEYPEHMPIREKKDSSSVLPSCPICRTTLDLNFWSLLEADVLTTMENYIIVIIRCARLMRRKENTDCYPFHGITTTM
jgi:hypothetical protein